jgi:hypothetical protein
MRQLLPLFRITPPLLFAYGLVRTFSEIAALRTTAEYVIDSSNLTDTRILYIRGLVRCFDSLFFYIALAALVAAANRYLEKEFG